MANELGFHLWMRKVHPYSATAVQGRAGLLAHHGDKPKSIAFTTTREKMGVRGAAVGSAGPGATVLLGQGVRGALAVHGAYFQEPLSSQCG